MQTMPSGCKILILIPGVPKIRFARIGKPVRDLYELQSGSIFDCYCLVDSDSGISTAATDCLEQ